MITTVDEAFFSKDKKDDKKEDVINTTSSQNQSPSISISLQETIDKLRDVAKSFGDKKSNGIQVYDISSPEDDIYMIQAKTTDENTEPDKNACFESIKEYVFYFAGEEISKSLQIDKMLPMFKEVQQDQQQNNQQQNTQQNTNQQSQAQGQQQTGQPTQQSQTAQQNQQQTQTQAQTTSESFILGNGIEDILFEADQQQQPQQNTTQSPQDQQQQNNQQNTQNNNQKIEGYYIGYTIEGINGSVLKGLGDNAKTKGWFDNVLKDLQSMSISTRGGGTLKIGELFKADNWKTWLGKPDIDIDQIKSDMSTIWSKEFPQGHTDITVYRSSEIHNALKAQNKLNLDDAKKIGAVNFCIAVAVHTDDLSFDDIDKKVVATIANKSFGSHEKMLDRNKISENDIIQIDNFQDKNELFSDRRKRGKSAQDTTSSTSTTKSTTKSESVSYIVPVSDIIVEALFGLYDEDDKQQDNEVQQNKETNNDNASTDLQKKIITQLHDLFQKVLEDKFNIKISKLDYTDVNKLDEILKPYNVSKDFTQQVENYKECIYCISDTIKLSESKEHDYDNLIMGISDNILDLLMEAEDEDPDVDDTDYIGDRDQDDVDDGEVDQKNVKTSEEKNQERNKQIADQIKQEINKIINNDDFKQFFDTESNNQNEVYVTSAYEDMQQDTQLQESLQLITEGHADEYNKIKNYIDSKMTDDDFTEEKMKQYSDKYKEFINDLRNKFSSDNSNDIPQYLRNGQKEQDFKKLLGYDYMEGNSGNPCIKQVFQKNVRTKQDFLKLFMQYFPTVKDGTQLRVELYPFLKMFNIPENPEPQEKKFNVRFMDVEPSEPDNKDKYKQIGDTQQVSKAEEIKYPEEKDIPQHEGYGFTGWDMSKEDIVGAGGLTEDIDIIAQYDKKSAGMKRIKFVVQIPPDNKEETVGDMFYVGTPEDLKNVEYPEEDKIPDYKYMGYVFDKWSPYANHDELVKNLTEIKEDITITGTYKKSDNILKFVIVNPTNDTQQTVGKTYVVTSKEELQSVKYPTENDIPDFKSRGYVFDKWTPYSDEKELVDGVTEFDKPITITGTYKEVDDNQSTKSSVVIIIWPKNRIEKRTNKNDDGTQDGNIRLFIIPKDNLVYKNQNKQDKEMKNGNYSNTKSGSLYKNAN